jgi:lipoprotein NlpI
MTLIGKEPVRSFARWPGPWVVRILIYALLASWLWSSTGSAQEPTPQESQRLGSVQADPKKLAAADSADLAKTGIEAIENERWDEAIRVLSQAIAIQGPSDRDRANAHVNRGYAYFALGQARKAIADYTAAIRLVPNEAHPHSLRAWAHFTEGKTKEAIADSTLAIRLEPTLAFAFRTRGRAELYAGRLQPAVDNFATAVELAPADVIGVIWLHVARVRAGQADQQEFTSNLAKIDRGTWPGPLADVLTGTITQEQLRDIAKSVTGEKLQGERVCEAQVYLGLLQLSAGDKNEARNLFKSAVADCPPGVAEATERTVARIELKRLGTGPARVAPALSKPATAEQRSTQPNPFR